MPEFVFVFDHKGRLLYIQPKGSSDRGYPLEQQYIVTMTDTGLLGLAIVKAQALHAQNKCLRRKYGQSRFFRDLAAAEDEALLRTTQDFWSTRNAIGAMYNGAIASFKRAFPATESANIRRGKSYRSKKGGGVSAAEAVRRVIESRKESQGNAAGDQSTTDESGKAE